MSPPRSSQPSSDESPVAHVAVDAVAGLSAAERLAASREQLRLAMLPTRPVRRIRGGASSDSSAVAQPDLSADPAEFGWRDRFLSTPGIALLLDVVESWWARHPLRTVVTLAGEASTSMVRPLARRNPFRLVLVAFIAGAILSKLRPWRWLPRRALFAGLLPQIALRVASELPVQKWVAKMNRD